MQTFKIDRLQEWGNLKVLFLTSVIHFIFCDVMRLKLLQFKDLKLIKWEDVQHENVEG